MNVKEKRLFSLKLTKKTGVKSLYALYYFTYSFNFHDQIKKHSKIKKNICLGSQYFIYVKLVKWPFCLSWTCLRLLRAEKVDDIYGNNRWQKTKGAIDGKRTIGTIDNKKNNRCKLELELMLTQDFWKWYWANSEYLRFIRLPILFLNPASNNSA